MAKALTAKTNSEIKIMKNKPSPRLSVLPLAVAFDDSASIDHTVYAHLCAVMCLHFTSSASASDMPE